MISARPKDYDSHELEVKRIRQAASAASRRCENRMIQKGLRNNPPSVYNIVEKVLIRYPPEKKVSSKRSILKAKILSRKLKTCKYKVQLNARLVPLRLLLNGSPLMT